MGDPRQLVVVDAFADRPFAGNPAAVCVLDAPGPQGWMQAVAAEMALSETAFVVPTADGFDLRWFTPTKEVELCGHATLASAHVLWADGHLDPTEPARFATLGGPLTCTRAGADAIRMDFPADPTRGADLPEVASSLGWPGAPVHVADSRFLLVELPSPEAVRDLDPDANAISAACPEPVIATAAGALPGQVGVSCTSRVFGPMVGIPEDPVTGSAHCTLAEFWGERLGLDELLGHQASARGGIVGMRRRGERVELEGTAVTVARTTLEPAAGPA